MGRLHHDLGGERPVTRRVGKRRRCIVQGHTIRKMFGFVAAFFQTGIVRVFAEKYFVHMRRCRDESLMFRGLLSGCFLHHLISGYGLGLCVRCQRLI